MKPSTRSRRSTSGESYDIYEDIEDLHREAMNALKESHAEHCSDLSKDFKDDLKAAEERYQLLLEQTEAMGFRAGTPASNNPGARAVASADFLALKIG